MTHEDPRDKYFMSLALREAEAAANKGEVPVGAVITTGDHILACTHNLTETLNDVTAHAEILAITAAEEAIGGKYLPQCTLYVTVEPCVMCAGALGWSQIGRIVYGTKDLKKGFTKYCEIHSPLHPKTVLKSGVMEQEAREAMKNFFEEKRKKR